MKSAIQNKLKNVFLYLSYYHHSIDVSEIFLRMIPEHSKEFIYMYHYINTIQYMFPESFSV